MTTKEIILSYPKIFGKPPFDPKKTLIGFGFGVSEYWMPILENGFKELNEKAPDNYIILQVKEKFGMLDINDKNGTKETEEIIKEMKVSCSKICMQCGEPGNLRRIGGWIDTLCDNCAFKKKNGIPNL